MTAARSATCTDPAPRPNEARRGEAAGSWAGRAATRFNPTLTELYQRLPKAGKSRKPAFVAVARELITILNAIARERTAWQA